MSDVAFLMIAISFLMVAFLAAVAILNASPQSWPPWAMSGPSGAPYHASSVRHVLVGGAG